MTDFNFNILYQVSLCIPNKCFLIMCSLSWALTPYQVLCFRHVFASSCDQNFFRFLDQLISLSNSLISWAVTNAVASFPGTPVQVPWSYSQCHGGQQTQQHPDHRRQLWIHLCLAHPGLLSRPPGGWPARVYVLLSYHCIILRAFWRFYYCCVNISEVRSSFKIFFFEPFLPCISKSWI